MPAIITTQDLIDEVRDLVDEDNTANISDTKILKALDRAQDYAFGIVVKHYPDTLLTSGTTSTTSGTDSYSMPEDIFEDRFQKVEILESGIAWEVKRINYRDISPYVTGSNAARPMYYYVKGKQFAFVPTPAESKTIRYWYIKEVDRLVKPQGRITTISTGSNYIVVDDLGDDLTTSADALKCYVNLVDAQTGDVRVSLQISNIDTSTNRITFKSTPDRSTVRNRTISSSIPTTVSVDDYICVSSGTCIPWFKKPLSNFMIQHAVVALKRKLGESVEADAVELEKFETQVKSTWAGRESQLRVRKASRNWSNAIRRNFSG